jgi:prepilin-type N-terminal cleavage/methylation domain-containing protein
MFARRTFMKVRNGRELVHAEERDAFTLMELLVVVGVLALLGATLLPALANNRSDSQTFICMNNTKRLASAWLMYASDQQDRLVRANAWISQSGTAMDWLSSANNTNKAILTDPSVSLIAAYVRDANLFKCPSDMYQSAANPGPRVRSYSLNGAAGGVGLAPAPTPQYPPGRTYLNTGATKMIDLNKPGPAMVITFVDEHADSINDGAFMFNAGYPPASYQWRDMPASYHDSSGSFSFADGHSEIHRWNQTSASANPTVLPVKIQVRWWTTVGNYSVPLSTDYAWCNDRMPYQ